MVTRYIDTRPRAPSAIFAMEVLPSDTVRLTNTDTRRTFVCQVPEFRRHYEPMIWPN